ncbi:hypothetical protein CEP54_014810 [Fusarium duplospermum]|uniref:Helicase ATP-binding domain-containing protein n=1 Tax=Fusarium duplospermum TaxID=1325734 RepID=A0A428NTR8_9HYPO|nr:hypothetical protein CEP54_014810 [Fusarium duplospermum]
MSEAAIPAKGKGNGKAARGKQSASQRLTVLVKKIKTYNFASMRRPEKAGIQDQQLPGWYATATFEVTLPPTPKLSKAERRERQRRHADAKYPSGVLLPKAFLSALGDITTISEYNAFRNEVDFIAFVEVICPDIFGPAVSVMSSFSVPVLLEELKDGDFAWVAGSRLSPEDKSFDSVVNTLFDTVQNLDTPSEDSFPVPPPVDVINAYANDASVRHLVDEVARTIPRPVLIPVLIKNIWPDDQTNGDEIAQVPFILVHAIQLLLFATTEFQQDRGYRREHPLRRYTFDTGDKTVAGLFSMEDLNRAVLVLYTLYNRRCAKADAMQKRKPPQSRSSWMGYADPKYNPALETPEGVELLVDQSVSAQLELDEMLLKSSATSFDTTDISQDGADAFDVYAEILEWSWSSSGPDPVNQRLRENSGIENMPPSSAANFDKVCQNLILQHGIDLDRDVHKSTGQFTQLEDGLEGRLDVYTATIGDLDHINEFARKYPGGKDALVAELRHQTALELTMASLQPVQKGQLEELCERYGLGHWKRPSLYPNDPDVDSYLPHQVFDACALHLRAASGPLKHTILANEMGTGKTRTYLLALALSVRAMEKDKKAGKKVQFLPSLVVVPPHTVSQTFLEARSQFSDFNLAVFFGDESKDYSGATFLRSVNELVDFVGGLDENNPKSGRTIVISSWHTLSQRLLRKKSRFFRYKHRDDMPKGLEQRQASESTSRGLRRPKVKVYHEGEINEEKIEDCEVNQAHGNLVTYKLKGKGLQNITFRFLIADEAQAAKNHRRSFHKTLCLISGERLMWVTGTPLSASLRDLLSPLRLMWKAHGDLDWQPTEAELGWVPGLYHQDYDPEKLNDFGLGRATQGILTDKFRELYPGQVAVLERFARSNARLWYLSPHLFTLAGRQLQWGSDFASMVVRPILEVLQLRRTMRTGIMLPDGTTAYPGGENLPMTLYFAELELRNHEPRQIALQQGDSYASRMFMSRDIDLEEAATSPQEAVSSKIEASVNLSVHREALLGTFDGRLWGVVRPGGRSLVRGTREDVWDAVRHRREGVEARSGGPVVGLQHVEKIISNDTTHGAAFYYYLCREEFTMLAPTDCAFMLRWMAGKSPVATMALYLALKYVRGEGKRVMFYVDTPWIQQWTITFFAVAGFKVTTIRSSDKGHHRNRVIRDWNDPSTDCEVFVANINITATGVNMHGACATGAFLCWHLNFQVMQQAMARLSRIGQKQPVDWWLIKVKGSYHDHMERFNWDKWAMQLSAQVGIPSWREGAVREVCIYEIIKTFVHTPFNRYAWMVLRDMFGSGGFDHQAPETRIRPLIETAFNEVKELLEQKDEQYVTWHSRLNSNIDDRKGLRPNCFVGDDCDNEDNDDEEEAENLDGQHESDPESEDEDDDHDDNDDSRLSTSNSTAQKRKKFTSGSPVKGKAPKRKK